MVVQQNCEESEDHACLGLAGDVFDHDRIACYEVSATAKRNVKWAVRLVNETDIDFMYCTYRFTMDSFLLCSCHNPASRATQVLRWETEDVLDNFRYQKSNNYTFDNTARKQ